MKLPEIRHNKSTIDEYKDFLELQDKKPKTVENKIWGIVPFLTHIGEKDLKSVTKADIEGFMLSLKKSGKAPSSVHMYAFNTRFFLKWLLPDNDFFKNVKVKRPKTDHSKDEFVNISDVQKMLQVCKHQRDRAFLFVMWESAGRLEEILQLNVNDVVPEQNGVTITLRGKTGTRDVLLIDAVPDLMSWLNLYGGEKEQPLFSTTTGNRLTHTGAQSLVERIAKRAEITDKRVHCHSFRHGRITELANLGMAEMQLRLFAGWQNDSEMPATYIHTKKRDVYSKLLKLKGIEPEEQEINTTATTPKKCAACGTENPFDAKACYRCRAIMDPVLAVEIANEENKRRQELEQLKMEVEELRKAQKEKEELESGFSEIIAGEVSTLNQGEDWEEKHDRHWERLKTDPVYRKRFTEFEKPFLTEVFGAEYKKETEEFNQKEKEEHKKMQKTEDRLYNALINTKTLADNL